MQGPARAPALLLAVLAGVVAGPPAVAGEPTTTADERAGAQARSTAAGAPAAAPSAAPDPPSSPPGSVVAPVRPRSVDVVGRGTIEIAGPAQARGRWKGFPISLSLRKAPLPEVLRSFARLAGFNLVLDPRVQGEVTVELVDVPWDQALHVILKAHGMGAEVDGRVWLVEPR